jgi:hypothetical protein
MGAILRAGEEVGNAAQFAGSKLYALGCLAAAVVVLEAALSF